MMGNKTEHGERGKQGGDVAPTLDTVVLDYRKFAKPANSL